MQSCILQHVPPKVLRVGTLISKSHYLSFIPPPASTSAFRPKASLAPTYRLVPSLSYAGVGRMDEIFGMVEEDKKALVLQLAGWDPLKKVKVAS